MWALSVSKALLVKSPSGVPGFLSSPHFLNAHFIIIPTLNFSGILFCCIKFGQQYSGQAQSLRLVLGELGVLDVACTPTTLTSETAGVIQQSITPLVQKIFELISGMDKWFATIWTVWFGATA